MRHNMASSTAGPFLKVGRPVVSAAVDAGAIYLDSSGEPPFIRQVFEEFRSLSVGDGGVQFDPVACLREPRGHRVQPVLVTAGQDRPHARRPSPAQQAPPCRPWHRAGRSAPPCRQPASALSPARRKLVAWSMDARVAWVSLSALRSMKSWMVPSYRTVVTGTPADRSLAA